MRLAEALESRRLFCTLHTADPSAAASAVNVHRAEENVEPIDFDKRLGIPQSVVGGRGPEADALPDFFPSLSGSVSLDKTSQPGRTLVRFGTQVNNQGAGPGILISGRPGVDTIPSGAPITSWVNPDGSQNVLQAVYTYNGSSFSLAYYRAAGRFTYHSGHGHFHFDGYASYRLRHNVGGTAGDYVQRPDGSGIVGDKVGFCLINISSSFTTEAGTSSSTLPGYNAGGQPSTGCSLIQGVHVGRADVYGSGLEGQWLDVTGVPNGQYFIELKLDGENAVLESNESNNAKNFAYNLNTTPPTGGITQDAFEPNNSFDDASDFEVMGKKNQTGLTIHWGQDDDYFRFVASSSGQGTVASTVANGDVNIYLYDGNRQLLGSSTNVSGTDTITYTFVAGATYYVKTSTYNSTTSNNYQIQWNIKPTVDASAPTPIASVSTGDGFLRIARNGPTDDPLIVNLTYSGTALSNVDYLPLPASVTLASLDAFIDIPVTIKPGAVLSTDKTVNVSLSTNTNYVIGGNSAAVTLLENVRPAVSRQMFEYEVAPHSVTFSFSEDVGESLAASDLLVRNSTLNLDIPADRIAWDEETHTATFSFDTILPNGNYTATLATGDVNDRAGNPLASDAAMDFFVLAGDVNRDRIVDFADLLVIAQNYEQVVRTYSEGNLNYSPDGMVDFADLLILAQGYETSLGVQQRPAASAKRRGSAAELLA